MIPEAVIEEIRARLDPVEVIGRRVPLRKSGNSFSASCPFHADRTPSFHVYPDSKRFKCFGCGARGDAFEFLRRFEGKDFRTVVRELAGEVGVAVPEGAGGPRTAPREGGHPDLERACEAAATHWEGRLWSDQGAEARRYLAARGIEEGTARKFRVGWAPRDWHDLQAALVAFSTAELLAAGLLGEGRKTDAPYDRFRGRLQFPFVRSDRRVAGFGGRLVALPEDGSREPKYMNSPETPVFKKGQLLFGLHEAQESIRQSRRSVLVEGYFDVLALHQAGVPEVVAPGGTAVTEHQVALLQRSGCEELTLLFDSDPAGLEAPAQAAPALLRAGLTSRVARIPGLGASDPDTFLRSHGAGGLATVLDAATPLTEWLLERAIAARARPESRALSVEQKLLIVRDLRPFVAVARAGLPRALFEQRIARRLELYIVALRAELARGAGRESQDARGGAPWHA